MKIKISFCTKDTQRNTERSKIQSNLELARILEYKKWDVDYLDSDRRFKPMTRFIKEGLPFSKIIKNIMTNKSNDGVAKELGYRYKRWIKDGGLPFRTIASIKRNGVSLVDTAQYIDACYVKIENIND